MTDPKSFVHFLSSVIIHFVITKFYSLILMGSSRFSGTRWIFRVTLKYGTQQRSLCHRLHVETVFTSGRSDHSLSPGSTRNNRWPLISGQRSGVWQPQIQVHRPNTLAIHQRRMSTHRQSLTSFQRGLTSHQQIIVWHQNSFDEHKQRSVIHPVLKIVLTCGIHQDSLHSTTSESILGWNNHSARPPHHGHSRFCEG